MTEPKDPKNAANPHKIADGANGSYDARIKSLAKVTDEQYAQMPLKQQMAVMNAKRSLFEQNQKAKEEADALAQQRAQKAEQKRQAKIDAIRNRKSVVPEITVGKVAQYTLNPLDLQPTFRGFKYAAGILVQIFARILITVGLIAPDHPARTPSGALGYGLFRLLEEARVNLLPLSVFREKQTAPQFAAIRMLAARQYIVFCATIGVFVTGFLAILIELARTIFGSAYAFAQNTATSAATSGISTGGCPAISSFTGSDYASACLDGIFGTAAGSTASVVQSGLGTMLAFYSNMVLVFAGIIVLWIIISAIAETARTGVPFGKNFNPVWTPIRLIVALGLLAPLPSGLNSGQYIVISIAKWGSSQATTMWNKYATTMASAASSSSNAFLPSVPLDNAAAMAFAHQLFQVNLCEAVQNNTCSGEGNPGSNSTCDISPTTIGPLSSPEAMSLVSSGTGSTTSTQQSSIQPNGIAWFVPDGSNPPKPAAGYPVCGGITINLPTTTGTNSSTNTNTTPSGATSAAQTARNSILTGQNAAAVALETSLQSLANTIQSDAQTMMVTNQGAPVGDTSSILSSYKAAVSAYVTAQQTNVQKALSTYNPSMASNLSSQTAAEKQYGWVYAPVWLTNIVAANGTVVSAAITLPKVTPPGTPPGTTPNFTGTDEQGVKPSDEWSQVQTIFNSAIPPNTELVPSTQSTAQQGIVTQLEQLTSSASANPLAMAGTVGHSLMMSGFAAITPQDVSDCLKNPGSATDTKNPCKDVSGLTNGRAVLSDFTDPFASVDKSVRPLLNGVGIIMISMGFTLIMLTFIPLLRFILGILNWIIQVFEAVLAVPLMALSLLSVGGDGFMTQQFTTDMWMLVGVILRPMLMAIGMVVSLSAFNNIMQIVNAIFAPAVAGMTDPSDNSLLTLGVYISIYTSLAYTMANSAFKLIDMLPNWAMNWIGARLEARVDDASAIQQMSQGYVQNLAFSNRAGDADLGRTKERTGMKQEMMQEAEKMGKTNARYAPDSKGVYNAETLNAARGKVEQNHGIKIDDNEKPFK